MTKHILVIADGTATGDELQAAVAGPGGGATRVLVVAPALHSTRSCIARLAARGIHAEGTIGDGEPLRAAIDALRLFPADEVVLATRDSDRLVERVAEHFDGPILDVVGARQHRLAAA
jgi:hypothetical protein